MLKLCKQIKGGKRIKLIGGPGNGMIFVASGKMGALKYEVDNETYYYKRDGLSDGRHELFSFLGKEEPPMFNDSLTEFDVMNKIQGLKRQNFNEIFTVNSIDKNKANNGII